MDWEPTHQVERPPTDELRTERVSFRRIAKRRSRETDRPADANGRLNQYDGSGILLQNRITHCGAV